MNLYNRFISCQKMIKKEQIQGDIPSDKSIYKRTFAIAWPSTVESVLISLMGVVDMVMVGGIGANAIASVGITNQPKFILLAVILSLNVGVTVVVSRRKGEQDRDAANRCLRQAIIISLTASLILSILGFVYAKEIMRFAGANSQYIKLATIYFQAIMVGNFFNSISLTINAAQRGCGNTKVALRTNVTANIINLIFDYLLINGIGFFPTLGVLGAGIATTVGNIIACMMSLYSICDKHGFLFVNFRQNWAFDRKTIHDIFHISSSAFAEQVFMRIGFFMYAKCVAALGMIAFATHQVCMNILNISFAVGDGLSVATSSLVGQSLGAKRKDMAIIYAKTTQRIGLLIGFILSSIMIILRMQVIQIFTSDPLIIEKGSQIIFIICATMMFQITQVITFGCLRGAGDVKFTATLSLISVAAIRPTLTWLLAFPLGLGLIGAWLSLFLDQFIRFTFSKLRFMKGKWVNIKV
ncbi:MAG: MATE family efflux transporter [Erysipelotrichaceae bacterium]